MSTATFNGLEGTKFCRICGTAKVAGATQYYDDETLEVVTVQPDQSNHTHDWGGASDPIWSVYTLDDGTVGLTAAKPQDDEHTTTVARDLTIVEAFSQAQRYAHEHDGYTFYNDYADPE